MSIRLKFKPIWGIYWDAMFRNLMIFPIPFIGIKIHFQYTRESIQRTIRAEHVPDTNS